jgi:hypothetical protein
MPAVRTGSQIITTYPTTTIRTEITETDFAKSITTQGQNDFQQEQWIRKKADTARRMYEKSKSQKLNTFGAIVLRHDSGLDLQASPPKGDNTYAKSEKVYVIPVVQEQQFVDKEIKDLRENNLPTEDAQPAIVLEKSFMVKEQKDALKAQGKAEKKSENKVDDNSKIEKKSVNSVSENNASDNKKIERNEVFKSFVYAPNRPISANEYSSVNSQDDVKLGIDGIITKAQEKKSETEKLLLKVDEELSPGSIPTSANQ